MEDHDLTEVWKALADPHRRHILDLLRVRSRTTGELSEMFEVSRFAVMKHLDVLEEAGLIMVRRQGRERWNALNVVPLQQIYERWLRPYEAEWATSLLQLKKHVEATQEGKNIMAEQTLSTSGLMQVTQEVTINGTPARVFEAITKNIQAWWGKPYLQSPNTKALILEPMIGGRFYEDWGDGQGVLWATVTLLKRDKLVELTGPIAAQGIAHGVVRFELTEEGEATRVKLSHRAIGEVDKEDEAGYTTGWQDLICVRLKAFVESGTRYGLGYEPPVLP